MPSRRLSVFVCLCRYIYVCVRVCVCVCVCVSLSLWLLSSCGYVCLFFLSCGCVWVLVTFGVHGCIFVSVSLVMSYEFECLCLLDYICVCVLRLWDCWVNAVHRLYDGISVNKAHGVLLLNGVNRLIHIVDPWTILTPIFSFPTVLFPSCLASDSRSPLQ